MSNSNPVRASFVFRQARSVTWAAFSLLVLLLAPYERRANASPVATIARRAAPVQRAIGGGPPRAGRCLAGGAGAPPRHDRAAPPAVGSLIEPGDDRTLLLVAQFTIDQQIQDPEKGLAAGFIQVAHPPESNGLIPAMSA